MITLISRGDGTFSEPGTDVTWVRDSYTEPREMAFNCDDCKQPILEGTFFTCLDGGEAAHIDCTQVTHEIYPAPGSMFDSNNLWWTTAELADPSRHPRYPLRAECAACHQKITRGKDQDWEHAS